MTSKPHWDRLADIRLKWVQTYNAATDNDPRISAMRRDIKWLVGQLETTLRERDENMAEALKFANAASELEEQLETAVGLARVLAMGKFATPHPGGAFGLPPNTWEAPSFVQTMAQNTLDRISNPARRPS